MSVSRDRRVKFLAYFEYKPQPSITFVFRPGDIKLVKLECAERAVRLGKAEYTTTRPPDAGIAAKIAQKVKRNGR